MVVVGPGKVLRFLARRSLGEAVRLHAAEVPSDLDARWLQLHALYASIVKDGDGDRDRFTATARAYVAAGGVHASLAREWLNTVSSRE